MNNRPIKTASDPRYNLLRSAWDLRKHAPANREAVAVHELHAEVAEAHLEHRGVLPELEKYLKGIGESAR